jgi:hypothetical protein
MPLAVGGEGIYVIDDTGRRYLDSCSGVAVSSLGYNHPGAIAALTQQASTLAYAYGGVFRNQAAEDLADFLIARSPDMSHTYFLSSGSEIMEIALKTAFQYFIESGKTERRFVISRRQNYHGSTLGVLAVSGNIQRRDIFDPVLASPQYVSPCYAYRNQVPNETEAEYAQRLANELDAKIRELGAENVAAFVAETVVGSTSGAVPPVKGYFQAIRKVCDQHGVLLILDEVMCGMGRTGHLFACSEDEVVPDILTIGKGLAAGYQPISAMLVRAHIHEAIASGSGMLRNGQTFAFHATACATALAVQQILEQENLLANVQLRGEQLRALLRETFAEHPNVGDIRGRGLFVGVELVADRLTKQPLPLSHNIASKIRPLAMQAGMMTYPLGGTIDGKNGDHVLFAPPFIVTESEIEQMVTIFSGVLNTALG